MYLFKAGYKDLCIESLPPPLPYPRDSNYFPRKRKRRGVVVADLPLEIVVVESSNKNIYIYIWKRNMTFIIEWTYKKITDERYDVTLIFVYGIRAKVKTHKYKNTLKQDDIFFYR